MEIGEAASTGRGGGMAEENMNEDVCVCVLYCLLCTVTIHNVMLAGVHISFSPDSVSLAWMSDFNSAGDEWDMLPQCQSERSQISEHRGAETKSSSSVLALLFDRC